MSPPRPLRLDDPGEQGWRSLHASLAEEREAQVEGAGSRGVLARAWARAVSLGASTEGLGTEERLVRGSALVERSEPLEALWQTSPGLVDRALAHESLRDFALLIADPTGLVARSIGGGRFAAQARALHLIEGATWSEAARGTNAIGTAIAEQRAVSVEGFAHFGRRYGNLVCYAAPVHDPSGALVAVLDATSARDVLDARDATLGV
ncbi:MAG: GAF domain-containing protein, partial [Sandaracinaceae bacterium]|nr:GAF domain-containing protein [Sandaracinaceae bacterium]